MTEPPAATVLRQNKITAVIRCPYCKKEHRHNLRGKGRQWFAPHCGQFRTADQRAIGYQFNTMEENK